MSEVLQFDPGPGSGAVAELVGWIVEKWQAWSSLDLSDQATRTTLLSLLTLSSQPRWSVLPRGGHFLATEEPALLAADLRAFARQL